MIKTYIEKTRTTQIKQLLHNYPVTDLSLKLKDIHRNALNLAENTKTVQNRGTRILEMSDIHVKANISFILPF